MSALIDTVIHGLRPLATDVLGIDLRPIGNVALPAVEAGAHIDLHLPNGMVRSYSLVNEPGDRQHYQIAVLKDGTSRGGSIYVHERLRVGQVLRVAGPRNHFRVDETAEHSILVAGGIGVTPLLCMARRLRQLGRSAQVMYFARTRQSAAFVEELQVLGFPLHLHFDDEQGRHPDLAGLLAPHVNRAGTHVYACGPAMMLDAFISTCERLGLRNHHIERFAAAPAPTSSPVGSIGQSAYVVELRRSARRIEVQAGQTLLQALINAGVPVDYACEEGICGTCRTRVLEGEPEHRDSVLTSAERDSHRFIMPCVSGCRSPSLVLDL